MRVKKNDVKEGERKKEKSDKDEMIKMEWHRPMNILMKNWSIY